MKRGMLKINDISVSFIESGNGDDAIIFIHGFPFDKSSWELQRKALENDYRIVTFDIRGFGQSSTGTKPFSIDLFADDLIGLLDALHLKNVIVCGLSMGGYIALNAVSRYPGRFQKMILCDTQCTADTEEAKEKRYKTIEVLEKGGVRQWADAFTGNLFTESTLRKNHEAVNSVKSVILATAVSSLTSTLRALAERSETCSKLNAINIPTLILCGESDTITPPLKSKQLNDGIDSSVLRILPDAAHLSNIEQPELFNGHIREFLR